jgi:alkaline phosphatase D
MLVEWSTTESFKTAERAGFVDALPETDCTANMLLEHLPAGEHIFYRIRFADFASPTTMSEPVVGHFRTAPAGRRSVSFIWSGDTAGQGWGIDETRGGMRTYATMLRHRPDFFIHSGDNIYADEPIAAEQKMPNGELWHNIISEDKAKPAETLAEFRGNYKYNLLDRNVRAFNAQVPILAQRDDHEITNDWSPDEEFASGAYAEKSILTLAARGNRAFREFMPMREAAAEAGRIYRRISYGPLLDVFMLDMRSYRTSDAEGDRSLIFGAGQLAWLKRELMRGARGE